MQELTKAEFKEKYFHYGQGKDGWGKDHWNRIFEPTPSPPMRYLFELPTSPKDSRMMIVSDYANHEYRMFFTTIDDEERFFGS